MEEWKKVVAENLVSLRKSHGYTQLQLAEQLHYSDKAISKWERGESLPDLVVIKQLADFYGVSVDDLLRTAEEREVKEKLPPKEKPSDRKRMHLLISGMAALLVWLVALLVYVVLDAVVPKLHIGKYVCIYVIPVTVIVCLVFNSIWFNRRRNYLLISALLWTGIAAVFFTFYSYRLWKLFLIGIPAQGIILLWSRLRTGEKQEEKQQE